MTFKKDLLNWFNKTTKFTPENTLHYGMNLCINFPEEWEIIKNSINTDSYFVALLSDNTERLRIIANIDRAVLTTKIADFVADQLEIIELEE